MTEYQIWGCVSKMTLLDVLAQINTLRDGYCLDSEIVKGLDNEYYLLVKPMMTATLHEKIRPK